MEVTLLMRIKSLLFNQEIEELIRDNKVMAACDASVKDGQMGAYWMIMTIDKRILMERELFSKELYLNILRTVKAMILLDFINMFRNKSRQIAEGNITVLMDNKEV